MAPSGFVALCLELLEGAGPVRARRLFGGHGIDCAGLFFALVARDRLYLKVDARTQADFESAGCQPFDYTARGRTVRLSFWTVPDKALESPGAMAPWAQRGLEAARRARLAEPTRPAPARRSRTARARLTAPGRTKAP